LFVCVVVNCVCIINQIIVSLLLKAFVYVIRFINAKQDFLKVGFICSCILKDTFWYITKCFKKLHLILTLRLSGKWWVILYTVRLQIKYCTYANCLWSCKLYLNFKSPSSTILIIVDSLSLLLFVFAAYVSVKMFVAWIMVARIYVPSIYT